MSPRLLLRLASWYFWLGRLSWPRILLLGLFAAVAIEAVTAGLRFGLKLESTRDTASTVGRFTFGLRIHHGYIGVAVAIAAAFVRKVAIRNLLLIVAIGLILSDLFHHFLVLWPLTGSPQFDLVYPQR
jgi:hypothetical protein